MEVTLKPELEAKIRERVTSGRYRSESEVIAEALSLLDEHDRLTAARMEALRAEIREGLDDIAAGRVGPMDVREIKRRAREKFEARAKRP